MSNRDTFTAAAIGFGVGMVIGSVLALMYAPKSGHELRADIRHKAEDVSAKVRGALGKGRIDDVRP